MEQELAGMTLSPDVVFFRDEDKVVAFHRRTLKALTLDEEAARLLADMVAPGAVIRAARSPKLRYLLTSLKALSFIEATVPAEIDFGADLPTLSGPAVVNSYRIVLTEACNLRCTYCFQEATTTRQKSMTPETLERVIDTILKRHVTRDSISIHWFGGEPLLKFGLIEAGVSSLRAAVCAGRLGGVSFDVTTHGGLVTDKIAAFFARNCVRVLVSLDGGKLLNDRKRVDKRRRGTYDASVAGYRTLQRAGVDVGVIVTTSLETGTELAEGVRNLVDTLNPHRIHINTPQPTARGWEVDGRVFAEQLHEAAYMCAERGIELIGPHQKVRRALMLNEAQNLDCVAPNGGMAVSVGPDGQLGHCVVSWNGADHSQFRDTWDYLLAESWKTRSHKTDACRRCPAENVCGGPCPLEAELIGLDTQRCAFYLTMLEKVLLE